jgi:hypothetical protein
MLPAKVSPFGVPPKEVLLQRGEVRGGGLGDAFKGKGLSSCENIMKPSDYQQRGHLLMVSDRDVLAILQSKKGFVPFKDVLSALVRLEKDLWAQEPNLE